MSSNLMLHCGAREVDRSALALVPVPAPTRTWFPVGHSLVVDAVESQLDAAGFAIQRARFGLSADDGRLFATLDLRSELTTGVQLSVGVRNSIDKSLPLGFIAGSHTFVCDNMAFRSDLLVKRKHTRFGSERFLEAIAGAVGELSQFQRQEAARIEDMRGRTMPDRLAESIILRAFEAGIISVRQLPDVVQEWRKPSFREFTDRTAWSLYSAFTTVMTPRSRTNPQAFAAATMQLGGLFSGDGAATPIATIDGVDVFESAAFPN